MGPRRWRRGNRRDHRLRGAAARRHRLRRAPGQWPDARSVRDVRRRRIGEGRQRSVRARVRRGRRSQRGPRRLAGAREQRSLRRRLDDQDQARGDGRGRWPDGRRRLRRAHRRGLGPMPYGPHAAGDRERMLEALGIDTVDALFADIPEPLRASRLDLPEPEPELQLSARLQALAGRNRTDLASFLGAGVYRHWTPAAVDQLLLRGEWYTAYTPYQPEISQGTLQSIYEYESLIAELMDLDVVSASHYDGAAATAEAALMTCRATRRERVLVSRAIHPHYRQTTATYLASGLELQEIPTVAEGDAAGTTDLAALEELLADTERPVAGVIAGQPNFYGLLEPMAEIGRLAHAAGALFVAVVEPVSLAVLAPPGAYGADIAAGEGQPLGIAPQYGGPYLGLLASTDALVRQIPGRLVGMTTDLDGKRAFVMTMRAREQDIRRDKAASNICTNQALLALAASIYLATIGDRKSTRLN